jgi:hypothetical protein
MVDALSLAVLGLVTALLIIGLARQFAVSGPFWQKLDSFGIVPQWKFFARRQIAGDLSVFDDLHLLVRLDRSMAIAGNLADPGPWQERSWGNDRPLSTAIWNPHDRSRAGIEACMELLARSEQGPGPGAQPTALAYLTMLRHCLELFPSDVDQAIQFAIVQTRGRTGREPRVGFVSAWHCQ